MKKKEIVESSIAPTNKNVLWVDTSQSTPALKSHINGKWNSVSGETETKLLEGHWELESDLDNHTIHLYNIYNEDETLIYPLDSISFIAEENTFTLYSCSTKLGIFPYGQGTAANTLCFSIGRFNYYAANATELIHYWEYLINIPSVFYFNGTPSDCNNAGGWSTDIPCKIGDYISYNLHCVQLSYKEGNYLFGITRDYFVRVDTTSTYKNVLFYHYDTVLYDGTEFPVELNFIMGKTLYPIDNFKVPTQIINKYNMSPIATLVECVRKDNTFYPVYKDSLGNLMTIIKNTIYGGVMQNTGVDWTNIKSIPSWYNFHNNYESLPPFNGLMLYDKNNKAVTLELLSQSSSSIQYALMDGETYSYIVVATLNSNQNIDTITIKTK